MSSDVKTLLATFRNCLADEVSWLRDSANYLKSDDIVDDDACDNVTSAAQDIAVAFNDLAAHIGLEPIPVPKDNEPLSE
jgi:hypothetical protein